MKINKKWIIPDSCILLETHLDSKLYRPNLGLPSTSWRWRYLLARRNHIYTYITELESWPQRK